MATIEDEASLLESWNEEKLGQHEGKWIAWRDSRVSMAHTELSVLTQEFRGQMKQGNGPLFAFVNFMPRA